MLNWVKAHEGKKFSLTELGFEVGRIRVKYEENYRERKKYEDGVPESWIRDGYVVEVDR